MTIPQHLAWAISLFLTITSPASGPETWRGLVIAPEHRCAPYDRQRQYPYPQSIEAEIVAGMGGLIYGPYTGRPFASTDQTDIEHIIATSEAHDSGLCAATAETRRAFARDPLNLTLAGPEVNRQQKRNHDAGEWLPAQNRCWYADRVVRLRQKYRLTIDRREAAALEAVLSACESVEMMLP